MNKNPTILKDELKVLNADKSAVITELRRAVSELKSIQSSTIEAKSELGKVNDNITETTARLNELKSRAVSVSRDIGNRIQELKNLEEAIETARSKNSQELKLHLGRITEVKEEHEDWQRKISDLKTVYDRNTNTYLGHESEKKTKLRDLDNEIKENESKASQSRTTLKEIEDTEKKLTKERLKREDKIRKRESLLDSRELSITKREEDVTAMAFDLAVIYGRLKELYTEVKPDVDLDKLVTRIK